MYQQKTLDGHFFTTKGFYIFFIPVAVPYKAIYQKTADAGLKAKVEFGPILEKGKMFGFGWIGLEIETPKTPRDEVVHIKGDFSMYEHRGPYKTLGQAYKKIMKDKHKFSESYNLYLDDPDKVKAENCRTQIYFR